MAERRFFAGLIHQECLPPIAKKPATMMLQMAQLAPLHTITGSSTYSPSAARRSSEKVIGDPRSLAVLSG